MVISIWEIVFAWPTERKTPKNSKAEWNTWNVSIKQTSDICQSTLSTVFSVAYMSCTRTMERMAEHRIPEPILTNTDDGMVRIDVGDQFGWVSSHHLVPPKVNQLTHIWILKHKPG